MCAFFRVPRIAVGAAFPGGTGGAPLLQCHGTSDRVVLFDWGKSSFEILTNIGVKGEFKSYPVSEEAA